MQSAAPKLTSLLPACAVLECRPQQSELAQLAARMPGDATNEPKHFIGEAKANFRTLPQSLRRRLSDFGRREACSDALLCHGLPSDAALPPTPIAGQAAPRRSQLSQALLALFAAPLGEIVGYTQEKNGALFHDITCAPALEGEQSSAGSKVPLDLHTERCFHPFLPDYLLLLGLRPDPGGQGATRLLCVRDLLPLLSAADIDCLFQPLFRTGIDYSFGNASTEKGNGPVLSILYGDRDDPCLRYDRDLMVGLTPAARASLQRLHVAAEIATTDINLQPGSLLILDNHRSAHGRAAYTPNYDGNDRWLQRVYVVADLAASASERAPGSRIIRTTF